MLGLLVMACGTPTPAGPPEVQITLAEFAIDSPQITFTVGTPYHFVITNAGAIEHEWMIMPRGVTDHMAALLEVEEDDLPSGATVEVDFTFDQAGEYEFACHVPGHYEAGMCCPSSCSETAVKFDTRDRASMGRGRFFREAIEGQPRREASLPRPCPVPLNML